jgi:hypothetical protein
MELIDRSRRSYRASGCENGLAIIKFFGFLLFVLLNPFGLDQQSDDYTQSVLVKHLSPWYPPAGQDHVSAVVITDDAAESFAGGYPLPFDAHASVLKRIMCRDPAAVFVDLNFRTVRGSAQDMSRLIDALSFRVGPEGCGPRTPQQLARGDFAPVFIAVVRNERSRCVAWTDASAQACPNMVPLKQFRQVAIPLNITGILKHGRYILTAEGRNPDGSDQTQLTPAMAMAQAVCRRQPGDLPFCDAAPLSTSDPLVLQWGYYPSAWTLSRYSMDGCEALTAAEADTGTKLSSLMRLISGGVSQDTSAPHHFAQDRPVQACPYTDYVEADGLILPDDDADEALDALIKDRAVVYGADITALPDEITSPVQGVLPGLFAHAMAVDNLLSYGDGYWRDPPAVFAGLDLPQIAEILLALLFTGFTVGVSRGWIAGNWPRYALVPVYLLGATLFVVAVNLAFVLGMAWPPLNLVALAVLVIAETPLCLARQTNN